MSLADFLIAYAALDLVSLVAFLIAAGNAPLVEGDDF